MMAMAGLAAMGCSAAPMMAAPIALAADPAPMQVASLGPIEEALTRTDSYFITQYYHKRYNPAQKQTNNANCGPTSLAMALRAFGAEPRGFEDAGKSYELIKTVRQAMTGRADEGTWTYPVQVRDGARKFGLKSQIVFGLDAIKDAMAQPGRLMVININPSPAYANQLAIPYNGGHFALLTRIAGDKAYVNDPLGAGPIVISLKQLETALTTPLGSDPNGNTVAAYDGGILLWK
jgi:hypothetical protein